MSDRADRAKQFMPFASLKGYYDMVRNKEKTVSEKRELSEYKAEILSDKLLKVKKGALLKAVYYQGDGYVKIEGMVSNIDFTMRVLTIVKTKIPFDDIYDVFLSGEKSETCE